jgi:hypothetical protein
MRGKLIGLTGMAGAGKSTVAKILVERHGFVEVAFADRLKKLVGELFGFTKDQLWGPSSIRNEPDKRYPRADGTYLTPREALQKFGTEAGRSCYENIWVDEAVKTAKWHLSGEIDIGGGNTARGVVISDVRFPGEVRAIKAEGGQVWSIERSGASGLAGEAGRHLSENALSGWVFNKVLRNEDSLEELPRLVAEALEESL